MSNFGAEQQAQTPPQAHTPTHMSYPDQSQQYPAQPMVADPNIAAQQQAYIAYQQQKLEMKKQQKLQKTDAKAAKKLAKKQQKQWAAQQAHAALNAGYDPTTGLPIDQQQKGVQPMGGMPPVDPQQYAAYEQHQLAKADYKKAKISAKAQEKLNKKAAKAQAKAQKQAMKQQKQAQQQMYAQPQQQMGGYNPYAGTPQKFQ
eukprot:CAMPEP_0201546138 /NCGR_PEP_ID=MMETSP0173_2-20130828/2520_1 /ASSEMBLY_ACC=CAM_ASM_000268 /TAXON_ID=218659 /ORGANISM="Vexillifera sp., Strain DIVA3 564/2" /LENGTH=200 /DNA_ID=CAMNT_0047954741 /DNA_START=158 /DNA_END=760 /DNA_ORIENTATION=+